MGTPLQVNGFSFSFRQIFSDGTFVQRYLGQLGVLVQDSRLPAAGAFNKSVARVQSSNLLVEGGTFLTRDFTFGILIPTSDYQEAEAIRAKLVSWLYVKGEGRLSFDVWEPDTFFRASLSNMSDLEMIGTGYRCDLTWFIAPFRFSHEEYSLEVNITTTPEVVVLDTTTPIRGLQIAHPTWLFENNTGGPISSPITVFNTTTNESLTWQGTWPSTHFLRIDSTGRKVVEVAATEAALGDPGTDKMSGMTPGSEFPTLQGGEVNSITLTGLDTTAMTVQYHAEF